MEQITRQIEELEAFKTKIDREQLTYPLDKTSTDILNWDVPIPNGSVTTPAGLGTYDEAIEVDVSGKRYWLYSGATF